MLVCHRWRALCGPGSELWRRIDIQGRHHGHDSDEFVSWLAARVGRAEHISIRGLFLYPVSAAFEELTCLPPVPAPAFSAVNLTGNFSNTHR